MALDQFALLELLDALKAADADDVVRRSVEAVLQALIDAEATARIGADRISGPRPAPRSATGIGDRLVTTAAGDVEVRIPKLRTGTFFPALLEPRRRIDQALFAVVMEAYVTGTSTRKVDDLVAAMGAALHLQERGEPDLRRARRGAGRVPGPLARRAGFRTCSWTPASARPASAVTAGVGAAESPPRRW